MSETIRRLNRESNYKMSRKVSEMVVQVVMPSSNNDGHESTESIEDEAWRSIRLKENLNLEMDENQENSIKSENT